MALGSAEVAGAASGVFGDGDQAGGGGEVPGVGVGGQVTRGDEELGAGDGANPKPAPGPTPGTSTT